MTTQTEIIEFIRAKIVESEKSLRLREDMAKQWREGTDASWAAAAARHPSTSGKTLTKADRMKESETQVRIAIKCRREVEMFQAVLEELLTP